MMNEFYMRLFLIEFYKKVLVSSFLGNKLSSSLMIFLKINRFNIIIYLARKFVFNYNTFISLHVYPKQMLFGWILTFSSLFFLMFITVL